MSNIENPQNNYHIHEINTNIYRTSDVLKQESISPPKDCGKSTSRADVEKNISKVDENSPKALRKAASNFPYEDDKGDSDPALSEARKAATMLYMADISKFLH